MLALGQTTSQPEGQILTSLVFSALLWPNLENAKERERKRRQAALAAQIEQEEEEEERETVLAAAGDNKNCQRGQDGDQ